MDDADKNLRLCQGFIFNYDAGKPKSSTLGILEVLQCSYQSQNEPNVHLLVQDYGKGKSHYALVVANFFKQPYESPEVQGILHQIEMAVFGSGGSRVILEKIKAYKQRSGKHLVICLSGEKGDLKQMFLRSLRQTLEAEGITDSIAQQVCSQPLRYLEGLNEEQRAIAENFLARTENENGDVNALIQLLRDDNYRVIPTVVNISRELLGFPINFEADLKLEDILEDLLKNLCFGANHRFQGILILLEELYAYLQSWATNPAASGGHALQNITNICEKHKGRIALISFTQIRPSNAAAIPSHFQDDYKKLTSRLELNPSTYEPISSLELVLENLIIPQTDIVWQEFLKRWLNTLTTIGEDAYEKRIPIYRQRTWSVEKFHQHLTVGCFPLHPVTSSLLCNLDFTQGRTAIQFIKQDVKKFLLDRPLEVSGTLSYIHPVALVDAFIDNLSNFSVYTDYKKAYDTVAASAEPNELTVLKALFLFYASSSKLTKSDREGHEEILSILAGLSTLQTKKALESLEQTRRVIYKLDNKTYGFYSGFGIIELEQQIEAEVKDKIPSFEKVAEFCQRNLEKFVSSQTIVASQFVEDNKLISEDWRFEYKVYTVRGLKQVLSERLIVTETPEKGIFAYAIASSPEELQDIRQRIDTLISESPIRQQMVVAISFQVVGDLARTLLKVNALEKKSAAEKQVFGAAVSQLLQQWNKDLSTQLKIIFQDCTYHCIILDKIQLYERQKPDRIISALLQELYPFVPPVEKIDKIGFKSTSGSQIVGFAAKQIIADNLTPQILPNKSYENLIDPIFVTRWGLLKKTSQNYSVEVPTHKTIREAWDKISSMTALNAQPQKDVELAKIWEALSKPPYGYNEYTFTMLLAGWLVYHRTEVSLKGSVGIPQKKKELSIQIKPIREWANTDILDKPKDFVQLWIIKLKARLLRRQLTSCPEIPQSVDYTQAQQYIQEINTFLEYGDPEPTKVDVIRIKQQQLIAGIERVDEWFKPVEAAERFANDVPIEDLIQIYPALVRQLRIVINMADRDADTVVSPTQSQRDRQAKSLQAVHSKIERIIAHQYTRCQALATEEECLAYRGEVQQTIDKLSGGENLPLHFIEKSQESLQATAIKLQTLREQAKVSDCLSKIKSLFNGLGTYATQDEYLRIHEEIENLVREVPAATGESIYRQTIEALNQQQTELASRLEQWQHLSAEVNSRQRAVKLKEEIISQRNRFTQETSKKKLDELLSQLDSKAIALGSKEEAQAHIRDTLQSAEQKLQRIRDIQNLPDAFQVYQELADVTNSTLPENYQQQLQQLQSQARTAVSQKFTELCTRQLQRLEDYGQLKESLESSQRLLSARAEFADIKVSLDSALQNLDGQREELQKRRQDKNTIQTIRQHQPTRDNTICRCEESIKAIEQLQSALNHPEKFTAEIEQLLQKYRKQVAEYRSQLQNLSSRLPTVETLKQLESLQTEYTRLELVFKDSADYPAYQQLQAQVKYLREDLELMRHLENLRDSDISISRCHESLKVISDEQAKFHDLERFGQKSAKLREHLSSRVQAYLQELENFQQRVASLKNLKEARQLQEELLKKSPHYSGSSAEAQYSAICSEVSLLVDLLQMAPVSKINTIEACQAQIDSLIHWRDTTENLTPNLHERVKSIIQELEQTRGEIRASLQAAAREWLQQQEDRSAKLLLLADDTEKLKAANTLLKQIQSQKHQYIEWLSALQWQSLDDIEHQCLEIQNRDRESRILVLFQELPIQQRENLYRRLAAYLQNPKEDFNG